MKWTSEPPKEPGYYWMRLAKHHDLKQIIEVTDIFDAYFKFKTFVHKKNLEMRTDGAMYDEFAGPIPEPEE